MTRILKFQLKYFLLTILLFIMEIAIAVFVHDRFIRPYFGDFLVVILVYCFLKSFLDIQVLTAAISTLLFAYAVEILQYFKLVKMLGLENFKPAVIIIGSSFEWVDMLAYTMGIGVVVFIEKFIMKNSSTQYDNKK